MGWKQEGEGAPEVWPPYPSSFNWRWLLRRPPSQGAMEGPAGPEPCPRETAAGQLPPSLLWLGNTDPMWPDCPKLQEKPEMWIFI